MANGTIHKEYTKSEVTALVNQINTGITSASPSGVSVPTNTLKNIASINVKKGMNLIIAHATFSAGSSLGYRQIGVAENTTSANMWQITLQRFTAVNNLAAPLSLCFFYSASAAKTLYLNVKHNYGLALTVTGRIQAYNLRA